MSARRLLGLTAMMTTIQHDTQAVASCPMFLAFITLLCPLVRR